MIEFLVSNWAYLLISTIVSVAIVLGNICFGIYRALCLKDGYFVWMILFHVLLSLFSFVSAILFLVGFVIYIARTI